MSFSEDIQKYKEDVNFYAFWLYVYRKFFLNTHGLNIKQHHEQECINSIRDYGRGFRTSHRHLSPYKKATHMHGVVKKLHTERNSSIIRSCPNIDNIIVKNIKHELLHKINKKFGNKKMITPRGIISRIINYGGIHSYIDCEKCISINNFIRISKNESESLLCFDNTMPFETVCYLFGNVLHGMFSNCATIEDFCTYVDCEESAYILIWNMIKRNKTISFDSNKPEPRAVGLWLYDNVHIKNTFPSVSRAIASLRNEPQEYGLPENTLQLLGYAMSPDRVLARWCNRTADCIKECEVLKMA